MDSTITVVLSLLYDRGMSRYQQLLISTHTAKRLLTTCSGTARSQSSPSAGARSMRRYQHSLISSHACLSIQRRRKPEVTHEIMRKRATAYCEVRLDQGYMRANALITRLYANVCLIRLHMYVFRLCPVIHLRTKDFYVVYAARPLKSVLFSLCCVRMCH